MVYSEGKTDITRAGKNANIKTTLYGCYEIADRWPPRLEFYNVPDARIGNHISLEGSTNVKKLSFDHTLFTVQEGQVTVAPVVNTTRSSVSVTLGLKLTSACYKTGRSFQKLGLSK